MEPRAASATSLMPRRDGTLYAGGAVVRPKKEVAIILGIEPEKVCVIALKSAALRHLQLCLSEFAPRRWAPRWSPTGQMDLRAAFLTD